MRVHTDRMAKRGPLPALSPPACLPSQVKFYLVLLDLQAPDLITRLFDTTLRAARCVGRSVDVMWCGSRGKSVRGGVGGMGVGLPWTGPAAWQLIRPRSAIRTKCCHDRSWTSSPCPHWVWTSDLLIRIRSLSTLLIHPRWCLKFMTRTLHRAAVGVSGYSVTWAPLLSAMASQHQSLPPAAHIELHAAVPGIKPALAYYPPLA